MSTVGITIDGVRSYALAAHVYPGVPSQDGGVAMGEHAPKRVRPRLELTFDRLVGGSVGQDLTEGAAYRVQVDADDGWLGLAFDARCMTFRGASAPNGHTGKTVLAFVGDTPPRTK